MRAKPQALCDRARLLSTAHPQRTVAEILGISRSTLFLMKKRNWREGPTGPHLRQRPSDFAIQVRYLRHEELMAHYRAASRSIVRWRRELSQ